MENSGGKERSALTSARRRRRFEGGPMIRLPQDARPVHPGYAEFERKHFSRIPINRRVLSRAEEVVIDVDDSEEMVIEGPPSGEDTNDARTLMRLLELDLEETDGRRQNDVDLPEPIDEEPNDAIRMMVSTAVNAALQGMCSEGPEKYNAAAFTITMMKKKPKTVTFNIPNPGAGAEASSPNEDGEDVEERGDHRVLARVKFPIDNNNNRF